MTPHYEVPKITKIDTLATLTQGNVDGESLDATFPVDTPKKDLRFS